ncbi:ester cyclase [Pseudomonas putida]|uniref:ester cyclase n=1 Tax=Pseudomonas putida TaxID=303 RepID=UPI00383A612F
MNTVPNRSGRSAARWLAPFALGTLLLPVIAGAAPLVTPGTLIVDRSLPKQQVEAQVLAARRFDTFWNTGDEALAREALAASFRDNTLPPGRPQGIEGVLKASRTFRAAVPDLRCEVLQMIVAGDRVMSSLRFTGHFTGTLGDRKGDGQAVDFIAMDIYRIADGRVAEDWHLEDNLTFLQQAGLIAK